MDYKIFCFHGQPKFIEVDFDRFTAHKRNLYDLDWTFMDISSRYKNDPTTHIKKPACLGEMLEISAKLSEPFDHVRVDLYVVKGKIYFGELTFFHESGYGIIEPLSFEEQMGKWIRK